MPSAFAAFSAHPGLAYGFSERADGSMHRHLEKEHRARYFQKQGIRLEQVVTADLMHGADVAIVNGSDGGTMRQVDALITNQKNLFLSATGADCFIVSFFDPVQQAVGMAHVGWRGVIAGLVPKTIEAMAASGGTQPNDLLVGISPGIRVCHFEINPADTENYQAYPSAIIERGEKVFIDLPAIIKTQLVASHISEGHINDANECTYCESDRYFSYRRDKPPEVEPMVAYIGMRE